MFLIVYADRMAPRVPAELVSGPFSVGASLPVEMADGTRLEASIEQGDEPQTIILDILGERWRLERRPTPSRAALSAGSPVPEYWMVAGRAGAAR